MEPGRADKRVGVLAQALRRPTSHGRHSLYMALSARQRALQILPRRRLRPLHQTHHFNIGSRRPTSKPGRGGRMSRGLRMHGTASQRLSDAATPQILAAAPRHPCRTHSRPDMPISRPLVTTFSTRSSQHGTSSGATGWRSKSGVGTLAPTHGTVRQRWLSCTGRAADNAWNAGLVCATGGRVR